MLRPRLFAPARALLQTSVPVFTPSKHILDSLRSATPAVSSPSLSFIRHATHQAQGRANGAKQGPGKRLGAKKSGGEYVVPGNIIFRQRGTSWYPGENCKMGRDHCIYAVEAGYVRYYKDPAKHPDRQYIGVVFNKEDKLPYPPNAVRRRRLNMLPTPIAEPEAPKTEEGVAEGDIVVAAVATNATNGKRYQIRPTNWEIGRAGEERAQTVKKFIPGNRFLAWRKRAKRRARAREARKLRNAQKLAKKAKVAKPKKR
ncbi:hypothetical protein M011DRAFT_446127 [Sporormia fimetaria CBS 119925]|uniref:Large ribosomal subunit protein bL27m n=1 Tax=Sporormia fimetaria CBS 119925 TaxID=1340428 RepID=A0A6A6V7N3_9PLEO|nr:hypothetical protein M011DRAFT_446127 [Sporormia fimetaria CBS 119925]